MEMTPACLLETRKARAAGNLGPEILSGTMMPYTVPLRPLLTALCLAGCTSPDAALEPVSAPSAREASHDDTPAPADGAAEDAAVWADLSAGPSALCEADSPALAQARKQHDALERLVKALPADGSTKAFNKQVTALYEHACLAVARGDEPMMSFELTSALEAKTYWDDGLSIWLRSYLDLADGTDTTVWLPPTRRDIVTPQTRAADPLAPWLCSVDPEDDCARPVAGWALRAQRYFELWSLSGKPPAPDCLATLSEGSPEGAYMRWRACESEALPRHVSLPLGGLGLVDTGWVVIYGRRGHYQYCDSVTALDLQSGAHYSFATCDHRPELDGMERADAVDPPSPAVKVEVGTIDVERVREFAWAAMSVQYVQDDVVSERALGRELPEGVTVARNDQQFPFGGLGLSGTASSGSTTLGWTWSQQSGKAEVFGELSWSFRYSSAADDYAAQLLAVARLGLEPGCAPAALPQWVVDNLAIGRLPKSEYELVDPPPPEVLAAMTAQVAKGRCG